MNRRFLPFAALALSASLLVTSPGCSHLPFRRRKEDPAVAQAATAHLKTNAQGLSVELKSAPDPVRLGEVRQLEVTVILRNTSKHPVHLNFPSGQTIEIQLLEPNTGKVVTKWSTDRIFNTEGRYLLINPQERLEFNEPISTHDLQTGKTYTLETFFVGYEKDLRATKPIIPQP